MSLIEQEPYKKLFIERANSKNDYEFWLEKSRSLLSVYYEASGKDIDRAAAALATRGWDREALGYLAYSGFCFWHLPIAPLINETDGSSRGGSESGALRQLAQKLRGPERPEEQDLEIVHKVNRHLDLASIAFLARVKAGDPYVAFQENLLCDILPNLINDKSLSSMARAWPVVLDERRRIPKDKIDHGKLTPDIVDKIETLNPQKLAEKISALLIEKAKGVKAVKGIYPHAFTTLPNINPNIFTGSKTRNHGSSGSYFFDWSGKHDAVYHFDCEDPFVFENVPRLIAASLHETLHILQSYTAYMDRGNPQNLFFCEALLHDESLRNCKYDNPQSTNPLLLDSPLKYSAHKAYASRPTEFFAHLFDPTIEYSLCDVWQVRSGPRASMSDLSGMKKLLQERSILPPTPPDRRAPFTEKRNDL